MDLIVAFLREKLKLEPHTPRGYNYTEHGDIDSLEFVRFVLELEGHYRIRFTDNEVFSDAFHTLEGLAKIIEGKLK